MKLLQMGMYMRPFYLFAQKKAEEKRTEGNEQMAQFWEQMEKESIIKRRTITGLVDAYGAVALNWSAVSAEKFESLAREWADALPFFHFEIKPYKCIIRKRNNRKEREKLKKLSEK